MSGRAVERGELGVADTISLFLLVSLPWAFMLLRLHYDWKIDFGYLVFVGLFLLRNAALFPRKGPPQHQSATWKIGFLILGLLGLFVGIIWLSSFIDEVFLGFLEVLLIGFLWIRDIWLASLRAKGQLPDNETFFLINRRREKNNADGIDP